ncbi:MAG: potassium-transporting ATPase subunit KdpA [Sporocytophaga sp.]|uniref:potassium-transporting ATPase subunit KdpA n=1 Tax=Sporocytophaga sp. TaxID=2231183 RepID=UPI001B170180|nr:potassium-transporting ATPase subunit KdpA [Sporocytophaga sp.]MBO9703342.1 potassium-transporting ATPase subunit KdpA [Sporocytophaga sp.]
MSTEILGVLFMFMLTLLLAIPFGKYIARVYNGDKTITDFMAPIERAIYRICGIDSHKEMNWKQHMAALLCINMIWFFGAMIILTTQGSLPLNPDGNPSMSYHLAFNTAISFLVNCNLQHYSGETGVTYFSQLTVMTFLHFVSAATGMAALVVVFRAFRDKTTTSLGNFFRYFLLSCTRILLPVAIVVATILAFRGVPASFAGKDQIISMEGDTVNVSRGPAAGMIAIKHLGTNGGGWFGVNSAHPLENPDYVTNITEMVAQVLIPVAMIFAFGYFIKRKKLSWTIFAVMTAGFLMLVIPTIYYEIHGNPEITKMGIDQSLGSMEGKEIRFGSAASAYWAIITTVISTGSVNSMHDSLTPMSGTMTLLAMMINAFYGGCGVGILNYFIFLVITVFIAGLMVGRTPEMFGRKVEAREVKIAIMIALLHPFIILVPTAMAAFGITSNPDLGWLNNPGFHGFSEMLYEYTSSAANNGSGFEGLGDNTVWWNISCGFVLIFGRYLPIIGPVAIAGILASKKYIPESSGTLKIDSITFSITTFAVILIIAALAFFPALVLGPLAEYFSH